MTTRLLAGDCRDVLATFEPDALAACVTDPPYELNFMGKGWDRSGVSFDPATWRAVYRVLKPGAYLLAFGGTRTYHRIVCAIEDAGFEIRDQLAWIHGQGFPKSLDVSKAIDHARDDGADVLRVTTFLADAADRADLTRADIDRHMGTSDMAGWWTARTGDRCKCPTWDQWLRLKELLGFPDDMDAEVWRLNGRKGTPGNMRPDRRVSAPDANAVFQPTQRPIDPGTPILAAAAEWAGWGTALKPAFEPIVLARKPFRGTVASNVLTHGTGALNIGGCRIEATNRPARTNAESASGLTGMGGAITYGSFEVRGSKAVGTTDEGRWPANVLLDDAAAALLDAQSGELAPGNHPANRRGIGFTENGGGRNSGTNGARITTESGGASRFFYCSKASTAERNAGLPPGVVNDHPTVKPIDLMIWLVTLVTPPGGTVLDPFAGSGTTGVACDRLNVQAMLDGRAGVDSVLIDLDPAKIELCRRRIRGDAPLFFQESDR